MSATEHEHERVDIGDEHSMELRHFEGELSGLNYWHPGKDGKPCMGFITFAGRAWARRFDGQQIEAWDVVQESPLTLSPSLLCRACGDHGFIRDGKWVRA